MTYSLMRNFFPQPCFDPLTVGLMLAGTALTAGGTLASGSAAAGQATQAAENEAVAFETQALNDDFNAEVSRQRAQSALDVGAADAADFELDASGKITSEIASVGGSGFQFTGSKLAISEQGFQDLEFGVSRIAGNARIEATRLNQQGQLLDANADIRRTNARSSRKAGKRTSKNIRTASLLKAGGQAALGIASSGLSFGGGSGTQTAIGNNLAASTRVTI